MDQEKNTIICKVCRQLKVRISDGKFNDRDKKYRDEQGLLFNGKTCGSCHQEKMRKNKRVKKNL